MSTSTNTAIIPGSLGAIARSQHISLAESFMSASCVVVFDSSGSMAATDGSDGRSRYDTACAELANLQGHLPGKIAVLSFSDEVVFCPDGRPLYLGGGTDLARALRFARQADVSGMRFIVISDGDPNSRSEALAEAAKFKNKIDVIYVGPEDMPHGREFLTRLAQASGGQAITAERALQLESSIRYLLSA